MKLEQHILDVITTQRFCDWYNEGRYDSWISSDDNAPSDEEILEDLRRFFQTDSWQQK